MPHIWVKNPTAHKVRIIVYAPSETTYKMESGVFELKIPLKVCSRPSRVPREDHPSIMVVLALPLYCPFAHSTGLAAPPSSAWHSRRESTGTTLRHRQILKSSICV